MPVGKMVLFRLERRIFVVLPKNRRKVFLFVSSPPALRPPHRTGEAHLIVYNRPRKDFLGFYLAHFGVRSLAPGPSWFHAILRLPHLFGSVHFLAQRNPCRTPYRYSVRVFGTLPLNKSMHLKSWVEKISRRQPNSSN